MWFLCRLWRLWFLGGHPVPNVEALHPFVGLPDPCVCVGPLVPGWRLISCVRVGILVKETVVLSVGVLTRMTIILQGPRAWRCRVMALEDEEPESGV